MPNETGARPDNEASRAPMGRPARALAGEAQPEGPPRQPRCRTRMPPHADPAPNLLRELLEVGEGLVVDLAQERLPSRYLTFIDLVKPSRKTLTSSWLASGISSATRALAVPQACSQRSASHSP